MGATVPVEVLRELGVSAKALDAVVAQIMREAHLSKDGAKALVAHAVVAEAKGGEPMSAESLTAKAVEHFGPARKARGKAVRATRGASRSAARGGASLIGLAQDQGAMGGFSLSGFLRGATKAAKTAQEVARQINSFRGAGFDMSQMAHGSEIPEDRVDLIQTVGSGQTYGPGGMFPAARSFSSGAGGLLVGGVDPRDVAARAFAKRYLGAGGAGGLLVGGAGGLLVGGAGGLLVGGARQTKKN